MSQGSIVIKGIRQGLLVRLGDAGWAAALDELIERVDATPAFFRDSRVALDVGPRELGRGELERARALLAEAGYPDGITIRNYYISNLYFYPKVMVMVQEQLKKAGFNIELQLVEHPTYHEYIRKNLNPFVLYGGTRLPDGDVWLSLFFHSSEIPNPDTGNAGANFAHYRGIDDLIDQGKHERDPERRAKLYHEAQRRIMADAVCLPLLDVASTTVRNQKRVSYPFDPEYGEFALHYFYNYPEMLTLIR